MACGRACGVKARERRVWTPYRGCCGLGGARGLRSRMPGAYAGFSYMWHASLAFSGIDERRQALPMTSELFAGEVLTCRSSARIVENNRR